MKSNLTRIRKQLFLLVLSTLTSLSMMAQIPNWDMESWNIQTNEKPTSWTIFGTTTKVTPAANGSFAVKLQGNDDSGPGVVLYGNPEDSGFTGGVPFSTRPDSLIAYLKYDIEVGDTAWVVVSMSKNNVPITSNLFLVGGTYISSFKRMAFKIDYKSSQFPDTMFLAFTSTNPDSKNSINTNSWVIVDNISFTGTTQNVPNPDFETWTTQSIAFPVGWDMDTRGNMEGSVARSSDKYSGNYAMKIQTIFNNGDTVKGRTQTKGREMQNSWGPSFPVVGKPTSLKGFYKFLPQNGDTFRVTIQLFKNGNSIGWGDFMSSLNNSSYTPFSADIFYHNPVETPDSATIGISTFIENDINHSPRGQSVAYIDNLSFDNYIYAGTNDAMYSHLNMMVYPNPAREHINVLLTFKQSDKIALRIMDIKGKVVEQFSEMNVGAGEILIPVNISTLSKGIYFVQVISLNAGMTKKVVIE